MKLYKMKCIEDKNVGDVALDPENQEICYMVKLETNEDEYYSNCFEDSRGTKNYNKQYASWSVYMTSKLGEIYEDDEITYYFAPEEQELEVGETFELDGTVWERVV